MIESWLWREVFTEQADGVRWTEELAEPVREIADVWDVCRRAAVARIDDIAAAAVGDDAEAPAGWYETSVDDMAAIAARG